MRGLRGTKGDKPSRLTYSPPMDIEKKQRVVKWVMVTAVVLIIGGCGYLLRSGDDGPSYSEYEEARCNQSGQSC